MGFPALALNKKGTLVAAICVVLVVSWVGEPAQGSPSCAIDRCISECPSRCKEKAASACEGAKSSDIDRCKRGCFKACTDLDICHREGETCDCGSRCDSYCQDTPGGTPVYDGCAALVFQSCKDSCEKDCKGEKVSN